VATRIADDGFLSDEAIQRAESIKLAIRYRILSSRCGWFKAVDFLFFVFAATCTKQSVKWIAKGH
jgi:hypothetical protein